MHYLDFLSALHERLRPRTYLEIGVAQGHTLALSRCRSIGVDPAFGVDQELLAPVSLLRQTSDDYFAGLERERATPFGELPVDLAYIDGMHLFEYALRDFIAVEQHTGPGSVVAVDDVLPRNPEEAARNRETFPWTGDVFRITEVLRAHRTDLLIVVVDTEPTGTLLVGRTDPSNTVLAETLDEIVREQVVPDPQPVPREILDRAGAVAAQEVLAMDVWDALVEMRVDN